jgi:hypothetical protein
MPLAESVSRSVLPRVAEMSILSWTSAAACSIMCHCLKKALIRIRNGTFFSILIAHSFSYSGLLGSVIVQLYRCIPTFGKSIPSSGWTVQGKCGLAFTVSLPPAVSFLLAYITEQIPHATYLNPEDGGILLAQSSGSHQQGYTLSPYITSCQHISQLKASEFEITPITSLCDNLHAVSNVSRIKQSILHNPNKEND